MNSTGPLTISQLAGRFGSSNFTADMRTAAGGNEAGLRQFLMKYPSLFTMRGNMVSLCDGKEDEDDTASVSSTVSSSQGEDPPPPLSAPPSTRRGLPDVSVEMEAVQYFRGQLARREERWVPIKSLAGHLSQTTPEIRAIVGPQLDFKRWLLRHIHIFDVQGDVVALCDGLPGVIPTTPVTQRRITFDIPTDNSSPNLMAAPKTPPAQRRNQSKSSSSNQLPLHRSHSFSDPSRLSATPSSTSSKRHESPVTMTANEYKAVMFIKDVLERRGTMPLSVLFTQATPSTDSVRSTLGSTAVDLGMFLRRHPGIFEVDDDTNNIGLVKNAKLSVIITGSRPAPPPPPQNMTTQQQTLPNTTSNSGGRTLTGKGKIFHVAKLWGIVDLGEHEHVFFDRSIMRRPMDDLQRFFHIGETLCFHATMAHKTSRARWKATHVWKETEQEPSSQDVVSSGSMTGAGEFDDEINEFLPQPDRNSAADTMSVSSDPSTTFNDAELSSTGSVPIWNFRQDEDRAGRASVTVVPENYQMSASALSDLRFAPDFLPTMNNGVKNTSPSSSNLAKQPKKFVSVACQTVSTNDIIATQLYQDS